MKNCQDSNGFSELSTTTTTRRV